MELSSWTRSVSSAGCLRGLSVIHCQRVGLSTNTSELNPLKTWRVFLPLQSARVSAFSFIFIIYWFPLAVARPGSILVPTAFAFAAQQWLTCPRVITGHAGQVLFQQVGPHPLSSAQRLHIRYTVYSSQRVETASFIILNKMWLVRLCVPERK